MSPEVLQEARKQLNYLPKDYWDTYKLVVSKMSIIHFEKDIDKSDTANMLNACMAMLDKTAPQHLIRQIRKIRNIVAHYSSGTLPLVEYLKDIEQFLHAIGVDQALWTEDFKFMKDKDFDINEVLLDNKLRNQVILTINAYGQEMRELSASVKRLGRKFEEDRKIQTKRDENISALLAQLSEEFKPRSRQSEHNPQSVRTGAVCQSISCNNFEYIKVSKSKYARSTFLCPTCKEREYDLLQHKSGHLMQCMCQQVFK